MTTKEQLLEFLLSISDNNGNLLKGQKSYFTKALEARYKDSSPPIITPYLPANWTPQCSILEGMFIINTSPLNYHQTLADYGRFLIKRYIISEFKKGSSEVHIILIIHAGFTHRRILSKNTEMLMLRFKQITDAVSSVMIPKHHPRSREKIL